jgi:hypothetical protein
MFSEVRGFVDEGLGVRVCLLTLSNAGSSLILRRDAAAATQMHAMAPFVPLAFPSVQPVPIVAYLTLVSIL